MNLNSQLRLAIANKRLLGLRYKGRSRVVEPHDYGVRQGRERLLAYQRQASPAKGRDAGWRWLDVDQIEQSQVLSDGFTGSRAQPGQAHMEWDVLYARVAP